MFAETENWYAEQRDLNTVASGLLLALLHEHHPERSPPNITKSACKAVATPEPTEPELVPEIISEPPQHAKSCFNAHPMTALLQSASQEFGLTMEELLSRRRHPHLARARHVVMFLAIETTTLSFPQVGRQMDNRDHTTVLSGVQKMRRLLAEGDAKLATDIEAVRVRAFPAAPEEPIWS